MTQRPGDGGMTLQGDGRRITLQDDDGGDGGMTRQGGMVWRKVGDAMKVEILTTLDSVRQDFYRIATVIDGHARGLPWCHLTR